MVPSIAMGEGRASGLTRRQLEENVLDRRASVFTKKRVILAVCAILCVLIYTRLMRSKRVFDAGGDPFHTAAA